MAHLAELDRKELSRDRCARPEQDRAVIRLGLRWLRRRLEDHIRDQRATRSDWAEAGDVSGGRSGPMSDLEADWLIRESRPWSAPISTRSTTARRAYEAARQALRVAGTPAALDRLSALFGLAPFDEDVLLLAAAPRLEAAFAPLYGYAHDRLAVESATPYLAQALLFPQDEETATDAFLASFDGRLAPSAPLRRWALLEVAGGALSALAGLSVDERIAAFLTGVDWMDPRVAAWLRPIEAGALPGRLLEQASALARGLLAQERLLALLIGPSRSGRRACAAAYAESAGLNVLELSDVPGPGASDDRAALSRLAREAYLTGFLPLLDLDGASEAEPAAGRLRIAEALLHATGAPMILLSERARDFAAPFHIEIFRPLEAPDRAEIWRAALSARPAETESAITAAAEQFALGPAEIWSITRRHQAGLATDLWRACRETTAPPAEGLAECIEPQAEWTDIVLPPGTERDLRAIAAQARGRATVYRSWGFGRKLARGLGITALFAGASGVGKTMAAEIIAAELDLMLYRVDLAGVVSKYIGETEKNLRRVFQAAEAGGAVLFFDEADAIFGKRSEVKDSHDRYANIETSYLLQRMESFGGLAILATNLKSHLDSAFLRRMRFVVDFPFPDAALRQAIWARAFPEEAPIGDLDFQALSRIEIAGGSIAVVAINAAFLAAEEGVPIGMAHVARAAEAELRKYGKEPRLAWLRAEVRS